MSEQVSAGTVEESELPVRVYAAQTVSESIPRSIVTAAKDLQDTQEVIWRLFFRDAVMHSRQKLIGHLWAIAHPIMGMASFVLLSGVGVLNPGELSIPYPIFLFFSMSLWTLFVGSVSTVGGGLLTQGDLVLRTSVPKITLALAGLPMFLCIQLVNGIILCVLMVALGTTPSWWSFVLPFVVFPFLALGVGVGLILAVFGVLTRDVTGMVTSTLNVLMYVTPVIYVQKPQHPLLQIVVDYNPLTYLVAFPRELFFEGATPYYQGFLLASVFGCAVLILGIHGFYLIQDKVAERL